MSANKDQDLIIRSKDNKDWWMVTIEGRRGTVPASMVMVLVDDGNYRAGERPVPAGQLQQMNRGSGAAQKVQQVQPYSGPVGVVLAGMLEKSSAGKKEIWGQEKKKKKEDWKRRWFVLVAGQEPVLQYYKDQTEWQKRKQAKGNLLLRTAVATASVGLNGEPGLDFTIATRERNLRARADSTRNASDWVEQINAVAGAARTQDGRVF
eukprot:SAG31_NODE_11577_length_1016_cov_1.293348_1_plen_207_part_00